MPFQKTTITSLHRSRQVVWNGTTWLVLFESVDVTNRGGSGTSQEIIVVQ